METHFDRVVNGTKDDLLDEFEKAIVWARCLTPTLWNAIVSSPDGLRGFIRDAMDLPVK